MQTGKPKPSKIAGGLLTLVLVVIGVARNQTDQSLVKYHNDFVQKAYTAVVSDGWDQFVQKIQADDATPQNMAEYIKKSLQPPIEKWTKQAAETTPPEFAADFHGEFSDGLKQASLETKKLLASLKDGDTDSMTKTLKEMTPVFQHLDTAVANFQTRLKEERDFTFTQKK